MVVFVDSTGVKILITYIIINVDTCCLLLAWTCTGLTVARWIRGSYHAQRQHVEVDGVCLRHLGTMHDNFRIMYK